MPHLPLLRASDWSFVRAEAGTAAVDWLAARGAGAGQGGRDVWIQRPSERTDAAGGRGRKMAELRALVAVKRVIDFAVKVTGPPLPPPPNPETVWGGLLVHLISAAFPPKRQSHT